MWPNSSYRAERYTDHGMEIAFFLGEAATAVFGVLHLPPSPSGRGVVVCQSILGDFIPNYRREVVLSRQLVAEGVAVARFHYRGFGHSSGTPLEATFESMCDDTRRIAEHFAVTAQVDRLGFLGTRWGALIAARAAHDHPDSPLALWEPTLSAKQFFREGFRAQRMSAIASARDKTIRPQEELETTGVVDVLGYPLGRALYDSSVDIDLTDLLAPSTGPVLFVGGGHGDHLTKRDLAVVEAMRAGGNTVDVGGTSGPEAWWFIDEDNATSVEAAAGTADWLAKRLDVPG